MLQGVLVWALCCHNPCGLAYGIRWDAPRSQHTQWICEDDGQSFTPEIVATANCPTQFLNAEFRGSLASAAR